MVESKNSNKSGIVLVIIFVVLCVTALIGFLIIDVKDKEQTPDKEQEKNEVENGVSYHEFQVCTYDEAYESDGYVFFNDTVVYECQSTGEFGCYLTRIDDFSYCNKTDSVVMITDNQRDFLYNYETQEIILEVDSFEKVIYDELGSVAYFIFSKDGKEGIATLTGKVLIEPKYELISIDYGDFSGEYSLKNGTVVAKKDNKYGVIEIETDSVMVPFEYDGINVYAEYYVLRSTDKIVLTDLKLNTVFTEDVDDIFLFNDVIFAEKDSQLTFYDLNGNKIIEETISINKPYSNLGDTGYSVYTMDQYNQVITLSVYGKNMMDYKACYNIHLVENRLEVLDCKEVFDDLDDGE